MKVMLPLSFCQSISCKRQGQDKHALKAASCRMCTRTKPERRRGLYGVLGSRRLSVQLALEITYERFNAKSVLTLASKGKMPCV